MRITANLTLQLLIGITTLSAYASDGGSIPLQILSEPADSVLNQGQSIALTVEATGSPAPSYQWALNGDPIPGASGPTLVLQNVQPADSGSYSVFVENEYQVIQTDPAAIVVNVASLPFADRVANRGTIQGSAGVGRGNNTGAGMELLEPWTLFNVKRSVWVSWTAPQSGIATFSTTGSGFDTVLGAFQVIDLPLLPPVLTALATDDESGGYHTSEIQFNVQAGRKYAIGVASGGNEGGNIVLSWNLAAGQSIPLILLPPTSQTVNYGETASFSISVQSLLPVLFQWFKNDLPILGATASRLDLLNVTAGDVGLYHCQISLLGISILSSDAELQINTEGLKAAARNKLSDALASGIKPKTSSVSAMSKKIRALDATGSAGYSGTQVFQNAPGKDPGEPNHCGIVGGSSYWFAYTAPGNGTLYLSTDGSNFDTVLAVYVDNGSGNGYASLSPVACDNNSGADGRDSRVTFGVANRTYYIAVDGVNAATGTVYLQYSFTAANSAPAISSISGISTSEDSAATSRSFSISDRETAAGSLQVTASSSNPTLIPQGYISFGGSDGNRTVNVLPAANQSGSATITVTVRDANGATASTSFAVTVTAVNDVPLANSDSGSCRRNSSTSFYIPSLMSNDSDVDGNALSFYSFSATSSWGGKVSRSGNYLYYTAPTSSTSSDNFTYTITDGQGGYATGRVYVTITQ